MKPTIQELIPIIRGIVPQMTANEAVGLPLGWITLFTQMTLWKFNGELK